MAVIGISAAYLLYKSLMGLGQFGLTLIVGQGGHAMLGSTTVEGGTMVIEPYPAGNVVVIKAVPDSGYYVNSWDVDSTTVAGTELEYALWMNDDHVVELTFTTTPPPPPVNPPALINCLTAPLPGEYVTIQQRYEGWWEQTEVKWRVFDVSPVDEYGGPWHFSLIPIEFQAVDWYNNPAVGYGFDIWTSGEGPDIANGLLSIGSSFHQSSSKKRVVSDSEGKIRVGIGYVNLNPNVSFAGRCYVLRNWFPASTTSHCLSIGDSILISPIGMTYEEYGVSLPTCPSTDYGPDREYFTTIPSYLSIQYKDNTAVKSGCGLTATFSLKHTGRLI